MRIDIADLYSTRLLVFIEDEPQSNVYRQVLLDAEEFKRVSLNIGTVVHEEGKDQTVEVHFSDETYKLPDLNEIHE